MQYLILIAVLLIPVWGWAESSPNCTSDNSGACRIPINPDPLVCDVDMNCVRLSCVQRMREAMTLGDAYFRRGQITSAARADESKRDFLEAVPSWAETMKACVEGK